MMGGRGTGAGGVGGAGSASGWLSVGEIERVIEANSSWSTSAHQPLNCAGFPRLSFYVLVTSGAAGLTAVSEEFAFENDSNSGTAWHPLQASYTAPLNTPRLNGLSSGHAQPATLACPLVRMTLTAGADRVTLTWYIAASL